MTVEQAEKKKAFLYKLYKENTDYDFTAFGTLVVRNFFLKLFGIEKQFKYKTVTGADDKWYCAETSCAASKSAGIIIRPDIDCSVVSPEQLLHGLIGPELTYIPPNYKKIA